MRKPAPSILILILLLPLAAFAEGKVSSSFETDWGIYVVVFDVPQGKVTVNLPDDISAGDAVSGTVMAEPRGQTKEEQRGNADELNRYLAEIGKGSTPVIERVIKWTVPAALSREPIYLVLRDKNGEEVARAQIPIQIAPPVERPATSSPENYQFPVIGQAGKPIWITGPFDGNFDTTAIKIGGREARLIAESPRKLVVESSREVVGPTEIELKEGNLVAKRNFNNLRVVKVNQEGTAEEESLVEQTPSPVNKRIEEKSELKKAKTEEGENPLPSPTPLAEKPVKADIEEKKATKGNTETMPPTEPGRKYTIQIGSFKTEEEVKETTEGLISKGYPAFVTTAQISGKGTWHRVRIGTFKTIKEAKIYRDKLKSLEPSMESTFITVNN